MKTKVKLVFLMCCMAAIALGVTAQFGAGATDSRKAESMQISAAQSAVAETPIIISNKDELKGISLSGNYVLANDIITSGDWTPIGTASEPFKGTFDGNGFSISINKLSYSSGAEHLGLFGVIDGASIMKLHIIVNSQVDLSSTTRTAPLAIGGIAGTAKNSTITNCTASGTIKFWYKTSGAAELSCGGIVGAISSGAYVMQCYSKIRIHIQAKIVNVGGIAGKSDGANIENCYSMPLDADNTYVNEQLRGGGAGSGGTARVGGIVGQVLSSGSVKYCYNRAAFMISGSTVWLGGIIGHGDGKNRGIVSYYLYPGSSKNNATRGVGSHGSEYDVYRKTDDELKTQETFLNPPSTTSWSTSIWEFPSYPALKNTPKV